LAGIDREFTVSNTEESVIVVWKSGQIDGELRLVTKGKLFRLTLV